MAAPTIRSGSVWIIRNNSDGTLWSRDTPSREIPSYGRGLMWGDMVSWFPGFIKFSARYPISSSSAGPTSWSIRYPSANDWTKRP